MESPSRYRERENISSPTSPTRQIPKSAFFRAKSPYSGETARPAMHTLAEEDRSEWLRRMQAGGAEEDASWSSRNGDAGGPVMRSGSPQATLGHSPAMNDKHELEKPRGQSNVRPFEEELHTSETTYAASTTSSSSSLQIPPVDRSNNRHSPPEVERSNTIRQYERDRERYTEPSSSGHASDDSAGMMATLLANQAALDCEKMPTARWDEVDEWKKVRWIAEKSGK
jgi:hypothetical protein